MMELFQFVMAIEPANDGTLSICVDHSPPEMMEILQFVMAIDPANDGTISICDGHCPR